MEPAPSPAPPADAGKGRPVPEALGDIVLVLQGGGALGAYQCGVYEALCAAGIEPDWVIGTSIGAINASLIAGNAPGARKTALEAFWEKVAHVPLLDGLAVPGPFSRLMHNFLTISTGIDGFFKPNAPAFLGPLTPLQADAAGYYLTHPLAGTLGGLVDFPRMRPPGTRLTVGAATVCTGAMHYFDSRDMVLDVRHVMASGALPPAFPPVRVEGALYWDGGILSNTPIEAIFDDRPRRSAVVFAIDIWDPQGPEPHSIWEVMNRQKDVQYASRALSQIMRQKQIHRLRHIIAEMAARLPEGVLQEAEVADMAAYGCLTQMHVVQLLAPRLDHEDHLKDIDFSCTGIAARWQAGLRDMRAVLDAAPWRHPVDPLDGFHLHMMDMGKTEG